MSLPQLLLTSDAEAPSWNTCAWDPVTGTQVAVYRGGRAAPGTLALLAGHSVVSGERGRPGLQLWRLARRDAVHQRLATAGPVTALAVDPAAVWCVAAVSERLHVYHLSSGRQLAVLTRHYQTVTRLAFTDDGSHFVSAGDDALAAVWPVVACVDADAEQAREPLHVWSDHALPVTGLHVGGGGVRCRVCTCSRDQTAKVYQLASGQLLLSVSFDQALTAVTLDPAETLMFVGCVRGDVLTVALTEPPRSLEQHAASGEVPRLSGHTDRVTCLAVTQDGRTLASGSDDASARLWHIPSRQCIRTLTHRGAVTNLALVAWPPALRDTTAAPPIAPLQVASLQRQSAVPGERLELELILKDRTAEVGQDSDGNAEDSDDGERTESGDNADYLRRQLATAQEVNASMYEFMVNKLVGELG